MRFLVAMDQERPVEALFVVVVKGLDNAEAGLHFFERRLLFRVVGCLPFVENAIGPLPQAGRRRTSLKGGNRGMCCCGPMFCRPMGI